MKAWKNRFMPVGITALLGLVLAGCQSPQPQHRMAEPEAGTKIACQLCYDEAVRARTGPPKHRRYKTVLRHRCPGCYSDVAIYEANGALMIKCAHCAADGVACDKCLPPDRATE